MLSVRRVASAIRRIWCVIRDLVWEVQRWRSRTDAPDLRIEKQDPVHWGAENLRLTVANRGKRAGFDCRYCQYRVFSMGDAASGEAASSAAAWYLTDAFSVRAEERQSVTAHATSDACARIILGSRVEEPLASTSCLEALVCRDRFGTLYRFGATGSGAPEVWRESSVDRLLKRRPPAWAAWRDAPATVQDKVWTSDFRQATRRR